jgi:hypothetical protein
VPDLKVILTFIAKDGDDWDIKDVLDGRPLSNPQAQKDLIEMLSEDVDYIFKNSVIEFHVKRP